MGLNSSYAQVRGQILLMDPILAANKIFSLVIQEERQCNIGNSQTSTLTFNIHTSNNGNNNNNNKARYNSNQSNNKSFKKDSPFGMHCKKTGHTQDKCYRLHERTNHVEIDCHFIHDKIIDQNIFTKPLPQAKLFPLMSKMALKSIFFMSILRGDIGGINVI